MVPSCLYMLCLILKARKTDRIADNSFSVNNLAQLSSGKKMLFAVVYAIYDTWYEDKNIMQKKDSMTYQNGKTDSMQKQQRLWLHE
ncbi:MAG: hypothetical protein D3920_10980 [Candidatus Electrothrix sp. AW2]|nr:hypothetical protein [Candidatus Electrothrix gigas]